MTIVNDWSLVFFSAFFLYPRPTRERARVRVPEKDNSSQCQPLAGELEHRQLDRGVMRLLKRGLYTVAELDGLDSFSNEPALHNHPFIQDDIDIANRHLFFECRIARHAHPGEAVHLAVAGGLHPFDVPAEAVHANDPREELELAARLAFLQQELTRGGPLPVRLIDFIDFRNTF